MSTQCFSQAAVCFLLELGNGHKFFYVGTGSSEKIASLQIPYNYLDKVFLGHLHTDLFGDLIMEQRLADHRGISRTPALSYNAGSKEKSTSPDRDSK